MCKRKNDIAGFCLMGLHFPISAGIDLRGRRKGAKAAVKMTGAGFGFALFSPKDIADDIAALKKVIKKNKAPLIPVLSYDDKYSYEGMEKSLDSCFALLYDFVDAFIIDGFGARPEVLDSLLNIRLYNDDYRPILLRVKDDLLSSELDELISFALLSDIDGLAISNPRLLEKAKGRANGVLNLLFLGDFQEDAPFYCIKCRKGPFGEFISRFSALRLRRRIRRQQR